MTLNKLQIRALVFKLIDPIRNKSALDEGSVGLILKELREIEDADFEFISRILIKEADPDNQKLATALLYIAENLSPESFLTLAIQELNSSKASDSKKIFLMNILSGFGVKFSPEDVGLYLANPDDAINSETFKFLEKAKVDPEAQIDFLDFYFSSPDTDKKGLVESVSLDFKGDNLVNILSPLALSALEPDIINYCFDIMEKSKSILSAKVFRYLSYSKNKEISKRAEKNLRKLSLSGVYTKNKAKEYYENLLSDFEPPVIRISTPDGNSNFSIIVSRKTKDDAYFLLFIALNTRLGPFSCFGFSSITKADHDLVISRFVSDANQVIIPNDAAKKILDELIIKRIKLNKVVPYEYYCWERILDDISPCQKSLEEIFTSNLTVLPHFELKDKEKIITSSTFVESWFFRYSKNNLPFSEFIDKVIELKDDEFNKIEDYVIECAKNDEILLSVKIRITYLIYCLKLGGMNELADIYYSLLYYEEELLKLLIHILKRSLYEHLLYLNLPNKKTGFFASFNINRMKVLKLLKYVEDNWVEK